MPKTFYDKNENVIGVFYTRAENDALLNSKQATLYQHNISYTNLDNEFFECSIISSSASSFTPSTLLSYLTQTGRFIPICGMLEANFSGTVLGFSYDGSAYHYYEYSTTDNKIVESNLSLSIMQDFFANDYCTIIDYFYPI